MRTELFGLSTCPYTADMRQWLIAEDRDFVEFDVELNALAKTRFLELSGGKCTVPVLVEDGRVVRTGWMGRGCAVGVRR
jgi:glutaredoxin